MQILIHTEGLRDEAKRERWGVGTKCIKRREAKTQRKRENKMNRETEIHLSLHYP